MWNLKKQTNAQIERWISGCQRLGVGCKMNEDDQKVETSSYMINKFWDVKYSMESMDNNNVLYTCKLIRELISKIFPTKFFLLHCVVMDN